jgi:hypothetical protein
MKATLIVIGNESDHAEAESLVERLMTSHDPRDASRLEAKAVLSGLSAAQMAASRVLYC